MLVINGKEIPGTERVINGKLVPLAFTPSQRTWWEVGDYQTRPRAAEITGLLGHWTGGEAGIDTPLDDGPRVVYNMKNRKSTVNPGMPLRVSTQFVVGACEPDDEYAPVWQCMDIGRVAGITVPSGAVNARSLAVEVVSAGMPGPLDSRKRPRTSHRLVGANRTFLEFYPGQIRTWCWLAELLTKNQGFYLEEDKPLVDALNAARINIPRVIPGRNGAPLSDRFTLAQMNSFKGAMEHFHMSNTDKLDAGNMLCTSLLDIGFKVQNV